jgi:hypothetical protein
MMALIDDVVPKWLLIGVKTVDTKQILIIKKVVCAILAIALEELSKKNRN